MIIAKIENESTFTGTQLARDYLLVKYLKDKYQDFLFYWQSNIEYNSEVLYSLKILTCVSEDQNRIIASEKPYFHMVLQINQNQQLLGPIFREYLKLAAKSTLNIKDKSIHSINYHYFQRTGVYLGFPIGNIKQEKLDLLVQNISSGFSDIYKNDIYAVME